MIHPVIFTHLHSRSVLLFAQLNKPLQLASMHLLVAYCLMMHVCCVPLDCTGWPNKNRTFFEIPYFYSRYRYNHAVFAEVLRNYSRKQQATIFLNER